jgi:DNA-nicking Smr family endonuclease
LAGKRRLSDQELALWQAIARTVTPLKRKRTRKGGSAKSKDPAGSKDEAAALSAKPQVPAPAKPPEAVTLAPRTKAAPKPVAPSLLTPKPVAGAMPGIDKRQGERFRRGQLPIEGKIDLHGRTQDEAHDALLHFLERAHKAGRRNLLVITGKGMTQSKAGILKSIVPRWLNEAIFRRMVLAISQARPEHGGEGALYVLLKRVK